MSSLASLLLCQNQETNFYVMYLKVFRIQLKLLKLFKTEANSDLQVTVTG